jgi:hypothetical protein
VPLLPKLRQLRQAHAHCVPAQVWFRRMQGVEIDSLREGQQDLSRNGSSGA